MSVTFNITAEQITIRDRDELYGLRSSNDLGEVGKLINKKMMHDTINNNTSRGAPLTDNEVDELTAYFNSLDFNP